MLWCSVTVGAGFLLSSSGGGHGRLLGGGVVRCCVTGNSTAVTSLNHRVSLDVPAIAGLITRLRSSNCVLSFKGRRAGKKHGPGVCNLGPTSKCFIKISVLGSGLGVTTVSFGNSGMRLRRGVPCRLRGAPTSLRRFYGVVSSFVISLPIRQGGVLTVKIGVANHIGPTSNCDCDVFCFRRGPLTRVLRRQLRAGIFVRGSDQTVACNRCVGKIMRKRGGVLFIGVT